MQSSGDEAFDDFQGEFVEYLQRRFGVEREQVISMLARWLVHHVNRGGSGLSESVPELELELEHTSR